MEYFRIFMDKKFYICDCPCLDEMDPELRRDTTTEFFILHVNTTLDLVGLINPMRRCITYLDEDRVREAIKIERSGPHEYNAERILADLDKLEDFLDEAFGLYIKG